MGSQEKLIVGSDVILDEFFTYLDKQIGLQNVVIGMTGDHGAPTSQASALQMGMPSLDFNANIITSPLEAALEEKWPLKGKGKYVLQLSGPFLLLNPLAFEAAGVHELEAEDTARDMLKQVFAGFSHPTHSPFDTRQAEPAILTHVFTMAEMQNGQLPDTQLGRLVSHS